MTDDRDGLSLYCPAAERLLHERSSHLSGPAKAVASAPDFLPDVMLPNALPTSLPSPSAFHAAFFGARAADVRRIDLAGGCWMLCGKLAHALQPSEKENQKAKAS